MGLDYSIITFVEKEKLGNALNWLNQNSTGSKKVTLRLDNGDNVDIFGEYFKKESPESNCEKIISDINTLDFSTSLIFDIDPDVFTAFYNPYSNDPIGDFKEYFKNNYLGNGKISVGFFDANISKHRDSDVYELTFRAVTTDMSIVLNESLAVRNWIHELSKISESILTFIYLESSGDRILYYKGKKVEIQIEDENRNIKLEDLESLEENYLYDYYKLTEYYFQ